MTTTTATTPDVFPVLQSEDCDGWQDVLLALLGTPGTWLQITAGTVTATGRVTRVIATGDKVRWIELTDNVGNVARLHTRRIDAITTAAR